MAFKVIQPSALALFNVEPETLTMMWQTVILGMGMVFSVLAILWAILSVFKLVFAGKTPKAEKPAAKKEVKAEPAAAPAPASVPVAQSNDELIAVLTAAVAAYMAEEGTPVADGSFRVVSFRRVGGTRAWNSK